MQAYGRQGERAGAQPWPLESFFFVNLVWFAATEQNSWSLFLLYEPGPGGDSFSERVLSMTRRGKKTHKHTEAWTRTADKGKDLKVRRKPGMAIESHTKEFKVLRFSVALFDILLWTAGILIKRSITRCSCASLCWMNIYLQYWLLSTTISKNVVSFFRMLNKILQKDVQCFLIYGVEVN